MTTTTLDDLKANITVIFKQIVANKIATGDKGKALFLYKNADLTGSSAVNTYKSAILSLEDEILEKYIKQIFKGGAKKVTVVEYKTEIADIVSVLDDLKPEFDYIMSVDADAQADIISYAKENEKFAVTYNNQADSIDIISIANPSAVLKNEDSTTSNITGLQLIPIVGGVANGCPYNMSVSYKVFDELQSVAQPSSYAQGQLVLYPEEEGIRLANACNTLQTTNTTYSDDMKSICIAEGMRRIKEDLIKAFRMGYKGRYKNRYDNQCLFYAAVNFGYIKELEKLEILDSSYDNKIYTDIEAQRNAWLARGESDAENWSAETVCAMTIGDNIYATMDVKMLDAMEGMQITVEMV